LQTIETLGFLFGPSPFHLNPLEILPRADEIFRAIEPGKDNGWQGPRGYGEREAVWGSVVGPIDWATQLHRSQG